jgi:hypothetical protein
MKLVPLGLALALLLPASLAAAQPQPRQDPRADRAGARDARQRGFEAPRAGPVCVPWCSWDQNPCDPPQFKIADGRCFQDG